MQVIPTDSYALAALQGFFLQLERDRSGDAQMRARGQALALTEYLDQRGHTVAWGDAVLGSHPVQRVVVDQWNAPIDVGLAPLVRQLWRRGIPTSDCCQGGPMGYYNDEEQIAYMGFPILDGDYPGPFATWFYDLATSVAHDVSLDDYYPPSDPAFSATAVRWPAHQTNRIFAAVQGCPTEPLRPWPTDLPLVDAGLWAPPPF